MIKTIIFDIDETIYSYIAIHSVLIKEFDAELIRRFGLEPGETEKLWKECYALTRGRLGYQNASIHDTMLRFQYIFEKKGINPLPYAHELNIRYWNEFLDRMVLEPYVLEFIQEMKKRGIRMGIATDMIAEIQFRKMERLGLSEYFDFIVTSEEAGYEKPHEKFFALCLEKADCPAEECLMIGDNWEKDITGALHAGMQAAWYVSDALQKTGEGKGVLQYYLPESERIAGTPEVKKAELKEKLRFSDYRELLERLK